MDPSRNAPRTPTSRVLPTPGYTYSNGSQDRYIAQGWDTPTHSQPVRRTRDNHLPTRLVASTVFNEGGGTGSLSLVARDAFQSHADGVTKAIRNSLSAANAQIEEMLHHHYKHVQDLEAQLAAGREAKRRLEDKIPSRDARMTIDQQVITSQRQTLEKNRLAKCKIDERYRYFEGRCNDQSVEIKRLRAQIKSCKGDLDIERRLRELASQELEESNAHGDRLQRELHKPILVFDFLQGRRKTYTAWFDADVVFRAVLDEYAEATNQSVARLTGRLFGSTEAIAGERAFALQ